MFIFIIAFALAVVATPLLFALVFSVIVLTQYPPSKKRKIVIVCGIISAIASGWWRLPAISKNVNEDLYLLFDTLLDFLPASFTAAIVLSVVVATLTSIILGSAPREWISPIFKALLGVVSMALLFIIPYYVLVVIQWLSKG